MDHHELIKGLKQVAAKLGKAPTRREYIAHGGDWRYERVFGSYNKFLEASGLATNNMQASTQRDIKAQVQKFYQTSVGEYAEAIPTRKKTQSSFQVKSFPRVVCLGDLHLPWWDVGSVFKALDCIKWFYQRDELDHIVQLGDLYDMYSMAKFPRSHLLINPLDEIEIARKQAEWLWNEIHKVAPKAKKWQIRGNHGIRAHKRILEQAPEIEAIVEFKPLWEFKSVTTELDVRKPLWLGDVAFIHGFLSGHGKHRTKTNSHVIHGHTHKGYVEWSKNPKTGDWFFELDAGYLGDPASKPLSYTAVREATWTHGIGYLGKYGPAFIPFD